MSGEAEERRVRTGFYGVQAIRAEEGSAGALRMGASGRGFVKVIGWQGGWAGRRPRCPVYWWNLDPSFSTSRHVGAS